MATYFTEEQELPFSTDQMFNLVADVARYPEFIPWCLAARVQQQNDTLMIADLVVGYKAFREKYTSRITLTRPLKIRVILEEGPLTFLDSEWVFETLSSQRCRVKLRLSFEFRSKIKQALMSTLFDEAAKKMMQAFTRRAHTLYKS